MKFYRIKRVQKLPISVTKAWVFFATPANLALITPPAMHLRLIAPEEDLEPMYPGQIIRYTLRPLLGIRLHWMTEITHVQEEEYFVDEQRLGPYKLWHHYHHFRQLADGVEMTDIVDYALPMGIFGRLAHALFVKKRIAQIFDYRQAKLEARYGIYKSSRPV